MKNLRCLFSLAALSVLCLAAQAQTWTKLTNTPPGYLGTAMVLTDGTIMVEGESSSGGGTTAWYRLTPSSTGSYVAGTWTTLAAMPSGDDPLYFASAVLADGKVVVVGGEYLGTTESETNKGAIYNPATNTWAVITPPTGWTHIGDAASVVLPDGTWMIGNCGVTGTECTNQTYQAQLDESTLTWTIIGAGNGKADENSEEGWNLLPNDDVLTVDVGDGQNTEVFNPTTNKWSTAGNTVASLVNTACTEIGAAVLSPLGWVFAVGGTANTGVYNISTGTWSAGPTVPNSYAQEDGPAVILPSGNVLIMVGPGGNATEESECYLGPSVFYEFNGSTLTSVPAPTNAPNDATYVGRLVALPNGQVLFTDGSKTAEVYTAAGTYQSAWEPTISTVSATLASASTNNAISGTQFNGLSQGGAYGDDAQMATNYPLVRITNTASGNVVYAKTHNHSTMGVATGSATVSTEFDIPATIQLGPSELVVVANGIPSGAASVAIQDATSTAVTASPTTIASTASTMLSVTVTDTSNSANTPTGTVTFTDTTNSASLGSCTLASGTCSITGQGSAMAVGSNTITAAYAGVTDTYTASSGTTTVTVTTSTPTASFGTMSFSPAASEPYGTNQAITISDTLTFSGSAPSGAVTYVLNGVTYTATCGSSSPATCTATVPATTIAALAVNTYTVTAALAAGGGYSATTGASGTFTITALTATFGTMSFSPSATETVGTNQAITISDTLTYSGPAPTGAVTYVLNGVTYTATCGSSSPATCSATVPGATIAALAVNTYTVTAALAAAGDYGAASGTSGTFAITAAPTASFGTMSFSPAASEPAGTSQAITISDTLTFSGAKPSGAVTFTLNSVAYSATCGATSPATCTATVPATTIAALAANTYTVTAALAAGGGYSATTGASGTFTITSVSSGGQITFSSVSHNFGQVAVGTAATAYGLTITNTSTTTAYPFSLVFTPAKGFTSANNCPASLAAGAKCQLDFYFTPTATGPVSAAWSLASETGFTYSPSNGGTLTGSGTTSGGVSLTSAGHNFGTVAVGTTSATYGTELSNSTTSAETISLGTVSAPFSMLTNCGTTLAAGASCEIEFTYTPTTTSPVSVVVPVSGSPTAITSGGAALPNGGITLSGN